ncbi:MAG: glycosyltransferase family 2 protein [Acutalibacteraceae bacterium]|nr:glycosyltransferase family 2 protein [Acutalibacteraceae bacterium]
MSVKHSLIVPCFNEEGNVELFLLEAKKAMTVSHGSYELIFVNDGSSDRTPEKLRKIFNENKEVNIKVISFSRNFGKEAAMYAGFTYADGEYITVIDADLQQDFSYVLQMEKILDENPDCDMVAAYQSERKESKFMSGCKSLFYKTINRMSDTKLIAQASDFRMMRRCVVETILALPEYHRFSKGIFSWVGYNTLSIPYKVKERASGETKWSFMKLLRYAVSGIMAYTDLPLKLPYYFSAFFFVLSFIIGIIGLIGSAVLFISSVVMLTGAILSFLIGILGSYIGKIHIQVKDRPIFIAKEILTYEQNQKTDN